jgi:anaphase-promoting complex subunit 6
MKQDSADLKLIEAEQAFSEQRFQQCYQTLKTIADDDPYFTDIVPLYCSVLIELGKQGELYYIAHKLVNANPDSATSWYAVGSYYFLIKKYPQARKYF